MVRRQVNQLPRLVESFFREYLQNVRGASQHTIRAYRDTLRLLFIYLADVKGVSVADLQLNDLNVEAVIMFLTQLETERGNKVATRNCRLAAIRGFIKHLIRHDPTHAEQYQQILSLPSKKAKPPLATYLEPEDVRLILDKPDRRTASGLRDYAILLFLYNTGARVSEALAVRMGDLDLDPPAQVRLHGKGGKDRICPIWSETVSALKCLSSVRQAQPGDSIFLNLRGRSLTRDGVAYILHKYVSMVAHEIPSLRKQRITPHVFRHSCAVALLQAGVDVTVIRDYLGHASITTTSRYITTNLKMKREVLEAFWQHAGISPAHVTPWEPKPDLLAFLSSL